MAKGRNSCNQQTSVFGHACRGRRLPTDATPGAAEGGKTIALMFDAFDSDFWITGNDILQAKAKENGWTTLENISNCDQNKQNEQVKAMVERKVDGIIFIQTDNKAAIPAIRAANAANIPMVFFNRPPAPNDNKYGRDPGRQPQDHADHGAVPGRRAPRSRAASTRPAS